MAELFLGPLIEKTIEKVIEKLSDVILDYLKDQVRRQRGLREELQKLQKILPQIQAVLSACRKVEIKDEAINIWYWQLRDAIDEAEDVLDDFEYMKLEKQVSKNKKTGKVRSLMKSIKKKIVVIGKRALKIDPYLERLEVALKNLNEISSEVSTFRDLLKDEKKEQEKQELDVLRNRETGSLIKNVLVGRSDEMEIVSKWLRNSNQTQSTDTTDLYKNISLLSIVGHGGMGKTTLLQHIYNDATTLFDVQMWVCVSTNFNAKTVIKNILESIKKGRPDQDSLDSLQKSLQSKVKNQRFLLVLDDIWEADEEKWKNVFASLRDGNPGSKILISTRIPSIASNIPIENKETFQLKGLEENECFSLFKTHAFGKNSNVPESFLSIARDIAKKLSGSPLAAKVIGSSLKSKDMSYWSKVLNTDIGNLGQNDLLPILKLSYTYLPDFLQICFAFCSIYPEDHKFDKDDLVRAWIALNFVQSPDINSQETIEEIGRSYFDILVEKSFFDKFQDGNDDAVYYQMHDLLHNLAQSVSQKECFRATNVKELLTPPKTIRHLSLDINDSLEASFKEMTKFKNLRSLFLSYDGNNNENFVVALSKIFEISKSIRLLSIAAKYQGEISEMICCLTHLRYFYLNSSFCQLPRSISQLYHLQIIINDGHFYSCGNDFFPRDINNLYNLRYLRLPFDKKCMIYEIGKLKSLQEFNCFYVENEIGYGIDELEHMKELRKIYIHQLENIKDVGKVRSAKFYDKENLTDLSLNWGDYNDNRKDIVDHDLDNEVLDSFKPCNNLKRLKIINYMGVKSAIWMINISMISSLEYIELNGCLKWKTLPSFGQLPFLKFLYLDDMPEVEQLDHNKDCLFPSLEVLHIVKLKALQEWFDTTAAATENGLFFPRLIELCLSNCPKLQVLPSLPTKLQKLKMKNVGWKSCNWLQGVRNCSIDIQDSADLIYLKGRQELKTNENCQLIIDKLAIRDPFLLLLEPLRSSSSFRILTIKENDELVSFPSETWQWILLQHHSSLKDLTLINIPLLKSLKDLPSSLSTISSLKNLTLRNIPLLESLPDLPSSMKRLELEDLESLQCLPSSLSTISSLKNLHLINIPLLKSLPDLPSSLENLRLENLESLQCLPSSLSTISSLRELDLINIPLLKSLPHLSASLKDLNLINLKSLQCLPSSLSTISSLRKLYLINIPLLKSLPNLPSSLERLRLENLESLKCLPSSLSTISSLRELYLINIPLLKSLPDLPSSLERLRLENLESLQCQPSSLWTISSLRELDLTNIPLLKSLPDLPSSLKRLYLKDFKLSHCLPSSLSTISSLRELYLINIPLLKSLPDLPSSLERLRFENLESLQCLPSSLSTISSLKDLHLINSPLLKSLPDLPSSLERLRFENLELLQCQLSSLSTISSLRDLDLINIPLLKSLPDLPSSLEKLYLKDLKLSHCLPSSLSTISSHAYLHLLIPGSSEHMYIDPQICIIED